MAEQTLSAGFHEAQAQLVVQTADLPLGTLADMVESGAIDLQPGFQRRERWKANKQSALIESFLLNVPVPPIYLAEESDGTYTAIDGKQRLKAINEFLKGRFALRDLERLTSATGLRFEDLPSEITNALRLRPYLRVVTLLKQTDPLLKYEVFLRLNRAGEPLNNQEIRNVAFRGDLNKEIYEASANPFLRAKLKISDDSSPAYRDMADAEYVLRFLTLLDRFETFSGNLGKEMDSFMRANLGLTAAEAQVVVGQFNRAIARCEALWGANAFQRTEGNGWRDQLLAGVYDAQMLAVSILNDEDYKKLQDKGAAVVQATRELFNDPEFDKSVRTGTNTPARIRYRVETMLGELVSLA